MGNYSEPLDRETAKSLVSNKKHKAFKEILMTFWLSEYDDEYLHYGAASLEGKIKLSRKGQIWHNQYFLYQKDERGY
jgi:hypothetical protein